MYDTETGFYYLESRYYDPKLSRFINADILVSTGQGLLGNNMFAYCRNNPVNRKDISGTYDVSNMDNEEDGDPFADYGNTKGTGGAESGVKSAGANKVHGNSKLSTKPQHGYETYNIETGDVVKTGISGQKLNLDGTSPRANSQVNKLNASSGEQIYGARVVEGYMPNRQAALTWERANALRLWEAGNSMFLHQRPRPWEDRKCC